MRCISMLPGLSRGVTCAGKLPYLSRTHTREELRQTLDQLDSGGYFCGHVGYQPGLARDLKESGVQTFLVVRDPRDVVVSTVFFIQNFVAHRLHEYFLSLPHDMARIELLVSGADLEPPLPRIRGIAEHYQDIRPWVRQANATVLRFENLVGPRGGGKSAHQWSELRKISRTLDMALEPERITALASRLFDTQHTSFRKGQIGTWRSHFSPRLVRLFNNVAGETLEEWGYG